jgi:hypothetical protein
VAEASATEVTPPTPKEYNRGLRLDWPPAGKRELGGRFSFMDQKPPLTDSPWFWVLLFSVMALAALAAMGGKYGRRQSALERQYQARDRIAAAASEPGSAPARRPYAVPGANLVPLWPLGILLGASAAFAAIMLVRNRRRAGSPTAGHPQ